MNDKYELTEEEKEAVNNLSVVDLIEAAKKVLGEKYHSCHELKKKALEVYSYDIKLSNELLSEKQKVENKKKLLTR